MATIECIARAIIEKDGKFFQIIGDEAFEIKLTEEQKEYVRKQNNK